MPPIVGRHVNEVVAEEKTMKPDFEKPPVRVSKSGVSSVSAADILRSAVGQREIRKSVQSGLYRQKHAAAQSPVKK